MITVVLRLDYVNAVCKSMLENRKTVGSKEQRKYNNRETQR